MFRTLSSLLVVMVFIMIPLSVMAEDAGDLRKDIKDLKERLNKIEAADKKEVAGGIDISIKEIEERISNFIDIGGYLDVEYRSSDKSDKSDKDGFRVHHFSLLLKKKLAEGWSAFAELEYEDAPFFEDETKQGEILMEAMYGDAEITDNLTVRFGRYLTPAGIWNVDHYPPFVSTQERPQHIRQIFPQYLDGVQLFGARSLDTISYKYHFYVGNGFGEAGSGDSNASKDVGARFVLKFQNLANLALGASGYMGRDDNDFSARDAYGVDFHIDIKSLSVQAEYAKAGVKDGSDKYYRTGWYTELAYNFYGNADIIYRYDWYEKDSRVRETTVNTFALNYHFTPKINGKLEYHMFDEPADSYYKAIASIAIYFSE